MASITNKPTIKKTTPAPAPAAKTEPVTAAPVAETPVAAEPKAKKEPRVLATHEILGINVASPSADRWIAVDTLRKLWTTNDHFWANLESFGRAALALAVERGGKEHDLAFWIKKLQANAAWQKKIGKPLPGYEPKRSELSDERKAKLKEQLAKGRATKASKAAAKSADADEVVDEG